MKKRAKYFEKWEIDILHRDDSTETEKKGSRGKKTKGIYSRLLGRLTIQSMKAEMTVLLIQVPSRL